MSFLTIVIIIVAATIIALALTGFGSVGTYTAQGQTNPMLTPEQKAAMCDPNDSFVNGTESRICGIPKTQSSNITTTSAGANTTTRTEALPPSSAIPGLFMPEQPPSPPTQSESVQPPSAKSIAPSAVP